jgi:hypothetical protein
MIRILYLGLIILLLTAQQDKLVKTRISENITAKLPADFYLLPPDELQNKSISYRMPIAYYTNSSQEVDFSVNNSASRWQEQDLGLIKELYRSNILNLFDDVEFINETIEEINNRNYVVFEFFGTVLPGESLFRQENPERKYYYIQYTLRDYQIYIFTFFAPVRQKDQWASTASAIMHSIKIK